MSQISITLTPTIEVDQPALMDQPTIVLLLPYLAAAGPGGGVTDHGALTGLGDDDHAQYHNNARGDARYDAIGAAAAAQAASQPLDSDLTAIAALTTTAYGRAFLALADAAAGRTALGLGTAATQATGAFDAAGAAAAAQAASQPLDSDLTAIAALTTTAYGRAFLALADAAAGRTALALGNAATAAEATQGEVDAGTAGSLLVRADRLNAHPKLARYLGVFTWAGLQAAYPNGGGALGGLASDVTVQVGQALWTPNADKSRWVPLGGRVSLYSRAALLSSYVARLVGNGAVQLFVTPDTLLIPAGMLGPGVRIGIAGRMRRTAWAATGAAQATVRLGTAGSSADSSVMAVNIHGSLNAVWEIFDSITILDAGTAARDTFVGRMIGTTFTSGNFGSVTANINTAADMYLSFALSATYVASDTVDLHEYNIWLEYGP